MNGIISESASRSSAPAPKIITSIILGTCLFGGFTLGMGLSPIQFSHLNPFRTETIRFDKISWIAKDKATHFQIALSEEEMNAQIVSSTSAEISFKPYELKTGSERRYSFNFPKHSRANFLKLEQAVRDVKEATRYDAFEDYQLASSRMRSEFSLAMNDSPASTLSLAVAVNGTPGTATPETVAMTSSSAEIVKGGVPVEAKVAKGENPYETAENASPNEIYNAQVAAAARVGSDDEARDALIEVTESHPRTSELSNPAKDTAIEAPAFTTTAKVHHRKHAKRAVPKAPEDLLIQTETAQASPMATATPRQNNDEIPGKIVNTQNVSVLTTQAAVVPYALKTEIKTSVINPTVDPHTAFAAQALLATAANEDSKSLHGLPASMDNDESIESASTGDLNPAIQKKLTDAMLALQLATLEKNAKARQAPAQALAVNTARERVNSQNKIAETEANDPDPVVNENAVPYAAKASIIKVGSSACPTLDSHEFVRPNGLVLSTVDSQLCPSKVTWLSKSRSKSGWIKVEGDDYLPTITLQPAANDGPTMLIDQNNLALIAIKSGVHVTKGMGIIVGLVPDGFKVDFNGRAEETEYFESSGKNYFAILNAEPGAGVVEVVSKTNPNFNSFVFTPVLEDTISYLDLAAPVAQNITIKVVKSGEVNDPEVAKLTVGLSTQSGIGAITRADGQATLKGVNLVHGFPVFVDVASRTEDNQSYTYRYQLKNPRRSGTYVVSQIAEKSIYHWLKQVKTGLSDQSAMVVGLYDRKKLDGFKNPHFTEVQALTAKFGLEPMNYTVLWNGQLSQTDPLEGDVPRFMSVQVPEGLSQVNLLNESKQVVSSELLPISPRVIHVISE